MLVLKDIWPVVYLKSVQTKPGAQFSVNCDKITYMTIHIGHAFGLINC